MTFGEKVRELRKRRQMTQEQLAELMGSHESHVGRYEKDQSFPTAPAIRKLAEIFNVSADYLLFDTMETIPDSLSETIADTELLLLFKELDRMDDETRAFAKKILTLVVNENRIRQMMTK